MTPYKKDKMTELTYIFHSCFVLETERCILVFDYWTDPQDTMSRFTDPSGAKPVYVFASHFHEDHFSRDIFRWRNDNPFTTYTYILSKDILKHRRARREEADVWLAKGGSWQDDLIKVTATGSNDSGVSWVVEVDGSRVFHAGDLCNWYARFLTEPITDPVDVDPVAEEKRFLGELKDIRKLTDRFDLVMFPVDGRIGNGYTLGARQWIERFKTGLFVPMHFVMSGFESAWRMEPFCREKGIPFWSIGHEGESITLADGCVIRHAVEADIPRLQDIFAFARRFMAETGNPHQWGPDYPGEQRLRDDIARGDCYAVVSGPETVASFVLHGGVDPTYDTIDGAWLNDAPYATIHRIASTGRVKGIMHLAVRFALRHYSHLRIDTHRDNKVMQKAILKEEFSYCGVIRCWNGGERLAYMLDRGSQMNH